MKLPVFVVALLGVTAAVAQNRNDSIFVLDEVRITDRSYQRYNQSQQTIELPVQRALEFRSSLAGSLGAQTLVHIKENGLGGVASPALRGTTAQHTALLWNGLQINSVFNGQGDLNLISPIDYGQVILKPGGGSVLYGSGAIGGTVHLNQTLEFNTPTTHQLRIGAGAFGQQTYAYQFRTGQKRFALETGLSYWQETNDYKRLDNGQTNLNGEHSHYQFNMASAYRLATSHWLKAYFTWNQADRHFALLTPTDTPTGMDNNEIRSLVEWHYKQGQWLSKLRAGLLYEQYDYFEHIDRWSTDFGKSNTVLGQYQLEYHWDANTRIQAQLQVASLLGNGSMLRDVNQTNAYASLQFSHDLTADLQLELGLRQDHFSDYEAPLLYSTGLVYRLSKQWQLRANGSKNYRVPTFNDLYWRTGGDLTIQPETAMQGELGMDWETANWKLGAVYFRNQIHNMIQWQPGQSSQWNVENVNKVNIEGAEIHLQFRKQIAEWLLEYRGQLGYTISENAQTHNQLIYVPELKHIHRVELGYTNWTIYAHALSVSEQYIRSDNNPLYVLDAYTTYDAGLRYAHRGNYPFTAGIQLRNLTNELYYAMERRPYPGRHINFQLQIEIQ